MAARPITPAEFDYNIIAAAPNVKRPRGNNGGKYRRPLADLVTAFDIETTRLAEIDQSIMYVWQWQFGEHCTVVGRTWQELREFMQALKVSLDGRYLVVFVHNLSYEFQFLRAIYDFTPTEVFAVKSRKVLKCEMMGAFEFRCSYIHSNMSLEKFTEKMGVAHAKLAGSFDYTQIRYPWTPLTESELAYCTHDVQGLVEAISKEMSMDHDNLYTLPLTSTGYVRRDVKDTMRSSGIGWLFDILLDYDTYQMAKEAFRGGNTHANRYYAGEIIHDAHSADRSSSYPDVQCNCKFPMGKFINVGRQTPEEVMEWINKRGKAILTRVAFENIRLRRIDWGCPYLSRDKCRKTKNGLYDNGRILKADYLETTLTDIDLRIILDEYDFDNVVFMEVAHAYYGKLPKALVKCTKDYYARKTALKGIEGEENEYHYMKSKNKLNSVYGMSAQDPVKQEIIFEDGEFHEAQEDPEELLAESNKRAFQSYAWGVWVTAWARYRLEEGIKLAHGDPNDPDAPQFLYCDTDSVKYTGYIDWVEYNKKRIRDSTKSGSHARDAKGKPHFMGVYEIEHDMTEFCTLGAKKYVSRETETSPLVCTIAGVNKKQGAKELEAAGGMTAFKPGFCFVKAGGLEAVYNDRPDMVLDIDGHRLPVTPNVCLRPSTYTLGLAADYERLLNGIRENQPW